MRCRARSIAFRSSRRQVLKTAAGVALAAAAPAVVPASVFAAAAPNDRINIGFIGAGNQAMGVLIPKFLEHHGTAQIVAVCDVNRGSFGYKGDKDFYGREPAQKRINTYYAEKAGRSDWRGCNIDEDFQEILGRDDIDAVVIAVPDHWHACLAVRAMEAGKDVYCEKPISLTVADGRAMVEAVSKYNRVFQTGSHERSNPVARHACELVRNGRIGKVKRVVTHVGFHNKTGPGPGWQPMPVPEGFNYERWLGPAPEAPYHQDRCLYRFRFLYDYSGGQITNYGAHSNDLAQWGLGVDRSGPVEIEYRSAKWLPEGSLFDAALETEFRCRYADGVELLCRTDEVPVLARFEGEEGTVSFGYDGFRTEPESLKESVIGPDEIHLYPSDDHVGNFLDCIRNRAEPAAPVEVGHRSATLCHLGVIACRLGKQGKQKVLAWDPEREQFTNDEDAKGMLGRPAREPWRY